MDKKAEVWVGELAPTPLGPVAVAVAETGLVAVDMNVTAEQLRDRIARKHGGVVRLDGERTYHAVEQLREFFIGTRQDFDLTIDWSMMGEFQQAALKATYAIPYGQTRTYGEIAELIGHPRAARAVGRAEATNPMPLVIPCHRVIGSDGSLRGYGGPQGIGNKAWLLALERGEKSE